MDGMEKQVECKHANSQQNVLHLCDKISCRNHDDFTIISSLTYDVDVTHFTHMHSNIHMYSRYSGKNSVFVKGREGEKKSKY